MSEKRSTSLTKYDPHTHTRRPNAEVMEDERLRHLAEDPRNLVYKWTYDKPKRLIPPAEVRSCVEAIWKGYDFVREEHPDWTDAEIAKIILRESAEIRELNENMHMLTYMCMDRSVDSPAHRDKIRKMIDLKEQQLEKRTAPDVSLAEFNALTQRDAIIDPAEAKRRQEERDKIREKQGRFIHTNLGP